MTLHFTGTASKVPDGVHIFRLRQGRMEIMVDPVGEVWAPVSLNTPPLGRRHAFSRQIPAGTMP